MTKRKLPHDNSKGIEGFVYQFYWTIDACFSLRKNEQLFVEAYGDIAVSGKANIEVKAHKEKLTDATAAIWNTLRNWLEPQFEVEKYQKLILVTTQAFSTKTEWNNWNEKSLKERKECLNNIHKKFENKKTEISLVINKIMDPYQNDKLTEILKKFTIESNAPSTKNKKTEIINSFLKGIPDENIDSFLNSLMGFILERSYSRGEETKNGEISGEDFTHEVQKLTTRFCAGIRPFPIKYRPQKDPDNSAESYLFVQKIKEIPYDDKIPQAYKDYMYAVETCHNDFKEGFSSNSFKNFETETIASFKSDYEKASLNCSDILKDSKVFYLDRTNEASPQLTGYESPNKNFRNGVLHMNMDDEAQKLKWRLDQNE